MTTTAIVYLVLSITILWGGFTASTIFLARRGEVAAYPEGLDEDEADGS